MTAGDAQLRCVICGNSEATTDDHIPPKCIFPKPRPSDLVTVPACVSCNLGASGLDEKFKVYLSLHTGIDSPEAQQLWEIHAVPTLRHNNKLRKAILKKSQPVHLTTKVGIIFEKGVRVLWDSEAHDKTIERIIRGLYFHHFGEILGGGASVKVQWYRRLTGDMEKMSQSWNSNSIGGKSFLYRYVRASDNPHTSGWIFQFYGRHWAGGFTLPSTSA